MIKRLALLSVILMAFSTLPSQASQVEVLHWWTAGGELDALNELRSSVEQTGNSWLNFPIKGGGGNSALTVLRSRAISGNPPTAALLKGPNIQEWAQLGFLTSLDEIAANQQWDSRLPEFIQAQMKYQGHYVAVPVNIHRMNWLWANAKLFRQANLHIPTTLNGFLAVLPQLQAAGIKPIAHTSEPWADAILFESLSLSILGPQQYRRAFVDLAPDMLASTQMLEVFTKLRVLSHYIDSGARGRSWDQASQMLSEGDAAMQIMGDWVAGYLTKDQQTLSDNIICSAFPGSQNSFIYNVDSFAFFKLKRVSAATKQAQVALASTILQPQLQVAFNRQKGSLPVVNDIDTSQFNRCTQQSALAYQMALKQNTLVPTFAQAMATTSYAQAAITRVVNNFIYDKNMSAQQAVIQLVNAVAAAQ